LNGGLMMGALTGSCCRKGRASEVLLSILLSSGGLKGGCGTFSAPRESILRSCGGGGADVTSFTCGQVHCVTTELGM
jgi:hypothetical protein